MGGRGSWRALLAVSLCALTGTAAAAAGTEARGIDPNQGESLVEITLADKAAAVRLQLDADRYGIDFQRALPADEPGRLGNRDRLRHRPAVAVIFALGVEIFRRQASREHPGVRADDLGAYVRERWAARRGKPA